MKSKLCRNLVLVAVAVLTQGLAAGCGSGGGGGGAAGPASGVLANLEVSPSSKAIPVGAGEIVFSALAKDSNGNVIPNHPVTWSLVSDDGSGVLGTITPTSGLYTPPNALPDSNVVLVKASSNENSQISGFASINLVTGSVISFPRNIPLSGVARVISTNPPLSHKSIAVLDRTVYAVWVDEGDNNIYFALSTDRGRTFTAPQVVNTVPDGSRGFPHIAVDAQGHAYIVWEDARSLDTGNDRDIFFRKGVRTDSGIEFTAQHPDKAVNDDKDQIGVHFNPVIAVDDSGHVFVAWEDPRNGTEGRNIYFAKGMPNDQGVVSFAPNVRVSPDLSSIGVADQGLPSIAVDSFGSVYVAWIAFDTDHYVYAAKGQAGSNGAVVFSDGVRVSDDASRAPLFPSLATDVQGNVYVVWEDFRNEAGTPNQGADIYLAKSVDGLSSFGRNILVKNLKWNQFFPSIAVDLAGQVYVVWEDHRNKARDEYGNETNKNSDVYFAKSMDGGETFGVDLRVNLDASDVEQLAPSIALDSAGRAYVIWIERQNACDISAQACLSVAMGE